MDHELESLLHLDTVLFLNCIEYMCIEINSEDGFHKSVLGFHVVNNVLLYFFYYLLNVNHIRIRLNIVKWFSIPFSALILVPLVSLLKLGLGLVKHKMLLLFYSFLFSGFLLPNLLLPVPCLLDMASFTPFMANLCLKFNFPSMVTFTCNDDCSFVLVRLKNEVAIFDMACLLD